MWWVQSPPQKKLPEAPTQEKSQVRVPLVKKKKYIYIYIGFDILTDIKNEGYSYKEKQMSRGNKI